MKTLLLDTHVVLWWLADDSRITSRLRTTVERAAAVHVSSASTWEVAIKLAIGKLDLDLDEDVTFPAVCAAQGFTLTQVDHADAWAVRELPPARADPFNRLIAASARRRGWAVVSAVPIFDELAVTVIRP